jgi:hypothetical protein
MNDAAASGLRSRRYAVWLSISRWARFESSNLTVLGRRGQP